MTIKIYEQFPINDCIKDLSRFLLVDNNSCYNCCLIFRTYLLNTYTLLVEYSIAFD